jgi:prophage DNA circulation protein
MAITVKQTFDKGTLDDLPIEMETIDDTFEKAIAKYDYPYADGADLEDMGEKAHTIKIRAYFYDDVDKNSSGYDDHILLLNNLTDKGLVPFDHPKYGLMQGKIESISVHHDDEARCAELDISFVEQMRGVIETLDLPPVKSSLEEAYIAGQSAQENKLGADLKKALAACDAGAVTKILDAGQGLLAQVQEYTAKTRSFVGTVEGYISTAEATVSQITSPINSLQATIQYSLTLPGRILGSIAGAVEKTALLYQTIDNYPALFLGNLRNAFDGLSSAFQDFGKKDPSSPAPAPADLMTTHLQIACAQRLALEAAGIYDAEETAFKEGDPDFQILTIGEFEQTLASVRDVIETAVENARAGEGSDDLVSSLKTMAEALLIHVNKIRLEREKMMQVTLDNPMPLHIVCLKYGLSYTDAERLLKVNRIRNPNFTDGEVFVYAR